MQAVQAAGFSRLYAGNERIILCARSCRHRALLVVDRPEQCCGVCLPTLTDRIGIMFACLDDRLHRPRSGAQHADAPVVDFPALCGAKEFTLAAGGARAIPCRTPAAPNALDGASWVRAQNQGEAERSETLRKLPGGLRSHTPGAVPSAIGETLAEIAEIAGMGLPAAVPNGGYRSAGTSVSVSNVFSSNAFKDLASPKGSSSGLGPGVIALSYLRNRTVTCGS